MKMSQLGDSYWDIKKKLLDVNIHDYLAYEWYNTLGTKPRKLGKVWQDWGWLESTWLETLGEAWKQLKLWITQFLKYFEENNLILFP